MKKKRKFSIFFALTLTLLISGLTVCFPLVKACSNSVETWAVIVTGWDGDFYSGSMAAYDAINQLNYNIRYLDVIDRGDGRFYDYATEQKVKDAIQGWLASQSDSNDICVLFFSSHGDDAYGGFLYLYLDYPGERSNIF